MRAFLSFVVIIILSFFLFSLRIFVGCRAFKNVELIVSKCYYASGIIAITIIYQVFLFTESNVVRLSNDFA